MRRMILGKKTSNKLFCFCIIVCISFFIGCASTKQEVSIKETQHAYNTSPCKPIVQKHSDEYDELSREEKSFIGGSEEETFEKAILIGTKQALRTFMERYPGSKHGQEVKDRIQCLEKLKIGIILSTSGRVEEIDKIKPHLCDRLVPLLEKYGGQVVFLNSLDEANSQKLSMVVEIKNIHYETNPKRAGKVAGAVVGGIISGGLLGGFLNYHMQKNSFGPPNITTSYWKVTINNRHLSSKYERGKDFNNSDEMFTNNNLFHEIRKAEALYWIIEREEPPIGYLKAIFKHDDSGFKPQVIRALENIQKPPIEFVTDALKDNNPSVRYEAAFVLGKIKDTKGVDPLIGALKDENSSVRWQAQKSLEDITGKNLGEDSLKWQEWWEKNKTNFNLK